MLDHLARNLDSVRSRIDAACRRAGRAQGSVTLIAVVKHAPTDEVQELIRLGVTDLGENRAAAGAERRNILAAPVRWHMIGHLQTNKLRQALTWMDVLHSVDRNSLREALQKDLAAKRQTLPVHVQINVSAEPRKGGYSVDEAWEAVAGIRATCPNLDVRGLMTMLPLGATESEQRVLFRRMRQLAEDSEVPGLSMGMSGDFEMAIEEGSTCVRVGTALFQG